MVMQVYLFVGVWIHTCMLWVPPALLAAVLPSIAARGDVTPGQSWRHQWHQKLLSKLTLLRVRETHGLEPKGAAQDQTCHPHLTQCP
jgi:hypothetical protein